MALIRTVALALLLTTPWASGCTYKVEHYGYSREIRIGKIGCRAPVEVSTCPAPPPVFPEPAPVIQSADAPAAPRLPAPRLTDPSNGPPPRLQKNWPGSARVEGGRLSSEGWVGLPDF
jgi:hypothetical protein